MANTGIRLTAGSESVPIVTPPRLAFLNRRQSLDTTSCGSARPAPFHPLRDSEWVVCSKRPFGGPEEVLRYLARYTQRVAISNRRLVAIDDNSVSFKSPLLATFVNAFDDAVDLRSFRTV